ncbi:hypothetical protein [Paenibacillus kandeliae]|uniref:hypothetical protein n=1 Tax=Paenibacillus kandeliae TaxID=3231269 RepID=UPI003457D665
MGRIVNPKATVHFGTIRVLTSSLNICEVCHYCLNRRVWYVKGDFHRHRRSLGICTVW